MTLQYEQTVLAKMVNIVPLSTITNAADSENMMFLFGDQVFLMKQFPNIFLFDK